MVKEIVTMFSYDFINRALVAGVFLSAAAALIGFILILKNYSMMGDGISHVAFGGVALASVLNIHPLLLALPAALISSFTIIKSSSNKINDNKIALFSAGSFAIGIFAISISTGINNDINSYLYGSILSVDNISFYTGVLVSLITIILFAIYHQKIFSLTYDEEYAIATGINASLYNTVLAFVSSVIIVIAMKMMGSLLVSAVMIFPASTAMKVFKKFKTVMVVSVIISVVTFVTGLFISYFMGVPLSSGIVIINLSLYLIASLYQFIITKQ